MAVFNPLQRNTGAPQTPYPMPMLNRPSGAPTGMGPITGYASMPGRVSTWTTPNGIVKTLGGGTGQTEWNFGGSGMGGFGQAGLNTMNTGGGAMGGMGSGGYENPWLSRLESAFQMSPPGLNQATGYLSNALNRGELLGDDYWNQRRSQLMQEITGAERAGQQKLNDLFATRNRGQETHDLMSQRLAEQSMLNRVTGNRDLGIERANMGREDIQNTLGRMLQFGNLGLGGQAQTFQNILNALGGYRAETKLPFELGGMTEDIANSIQRALGGGYGY